MKPPHFPRHARELGIVWYLLPALWVIAAFVGLLALSYGLVAEPLSAERTTAPGATATSPVSHASGDPSVPAASSVFAPSSEVSAHVDTF